MHKMNIVHLVIYWAFLVYGLFVVCNPANFALWITISWYIMIPMFSFFIGFTFYKIIRDWKNK